MQGSGQHITMRLADSSIIAPTDAARRILARVVLEIGRRFELFLFAGPDTHLHLATTLPRQAAGRLAHDVACSLRYALYLTSPFEPARYTPILNHDHLKRVVPYVLGNARRHGNTQDPRCEATNLPDLLGLRINGAYTAGRLRRLQPRITEADLLVHFPVARLVPGSDPELLLDAATASVAAPHLQSRSALVLAARIAAVHVADRLGLPGSRTAALLDMSRRSVIRARRQPPDPDLMRAIGYQMGLMEAIARQVPDPLAPFTPSPTPLPVP